MFLLVSRLMVVDHLSWLKSWNRKYSVNSMIQSLKLKIDLHSRWFMSWSSFSPLSSSFSLLLLTSLDNVLIISFNSCSSPLSSVENNKTNEFNNLIAFFTIGSQLSFLKINGKQTYWEADNCQWLMRTKVATKQKYSSKPFLSWIDFFPFFCLFQSSSVMPCVVCLRLWRALCCLL